MALLTAEAAKLSLDDLMAGIIDEIVTSDQLFGVLPFKPIIGKAYVYNREKTLSEGTFVDTDDNITEGAATFGKITTQLTRIIGDVDVDDFLQETYSDQQDQAGVQVAKKSKGVARKFANNLVNGNAVTNPKSFEGLLRLCTAAQTYDAGAAAGAALAFDHLDWLIDNVKIQGQLMFIMNSRTIRSYAALCRGLGGATPEQMNLPGLVGPIIAYRGIPIMKNDWNPINVDHGTTPGHNTTSILLAALSETEGVCGIASQNNLGIQVKVIGPVQNKDATRYRVKWYCGLAMHSTLSLACVQGITN